MSVFSKIIVGLQKSTVVHFVLPCFATEFNVAAYKCICYPSATLLYTTVCLDIGFNAMFK